MLGIVFAIPMIAMVAISFVLSWIGVEGLGSIFSGPIAFVFLMIGFFSKYWWLWLISVTGIVVTSILVWGAKKKYKNGAKCYLIAADILSGSIAVQMDDDKTLKKLYAYLREKSAGRRFFVYTSVELEPNPNYKTPTVVPSEREFVAQVLEMCERFCLFEQNVKM